jgi:hypothetical protein
VTIPSSSYAGPPFLTDDPEPVDYEHVEINFFTQATASKSGVSGILPGIDMNYGLMPDVQLHIQPQMAYNEFGGRHTLFGDHDGTYGYGDTELGLKYRFINETEDGWWPEVAIYPLVEIPTGSAHENLGSGYAQEFFPIWLQKDVGKWTTYGGGGYWNNPGIGNQNYWFFGWTLQCKITDHLALGGEVFHQTANEVGGHRTTGFNLGGSYDISKNYHLLLSSGRGIQNAPDTNQLSYYLALQLIF